MDQPDEGPAADPPDTESKAASAASVVALRIRRRAMTASL